MQLAFKTKGDGKRHNIVEEYPSVPAELWEAITIVNRAYDNAGNAMTAAAITIGVEGSPTDSLYTQDGQTYAKRSAANICWNDNGNVCYVTIDLQPFWLP